MQKFVDYLDVRIHALIVLYLHLSDLYIHRNTGLKATDVRPIE